MKIGLVYTGITEQLTDCVEREVLSVLGPEIEFLSWKDPSILQDLSITQGPSLSAAQKLYNLYFQAIQAGVSAILNICSSVGDLADAAAPLGEYFQVPIVRIDADMCRAAVQRHNHLAVIATLPTTMEPTKQMVLRAAEEQGKHIELSEILVNNAFGATPEQFWQAMLQSLGSIPEHCDALLLAQASMAYCAADLQKYFSKPVFSSPFFGALALQNALKKMEKISCTQLD